MHMDKCMSIQRTPMHMPMHMSLYLSMACAYTHAYRKVWICLRVTRLSLTGKRQFIKTLRTRTRASPQAWGTGMESGIYVQACARACVQSCAPVCVQACVHISVQACVQACTHACRRACVQAREQGWIHAMGGRYVSEVCVPHRCENAKLGPCPSDMLPRTRARMHARAHAHARTHARTHARMHREREVGPHGLLHTASLAGAVCIVHSSAHGVHAVHGTGRDGMGWDGMAWHECSGCRGCMEHPCIRFSSSIPPIHPTAHTYRPIHKIDAHAYRHTQPLPISCRVVSQGIVPHAHAVPCIKAWLAPSHGSLTSQSMLFHV